LEHTGIGGRSRFPADDQRQYSTMSTAKKARHTVDRLTGQAKQKIGRATGDNRLRNEGANDEMKARVKMTGQRLKDAFRGR
jgi:uncharacterized protein YjbJ (UPF0337 family)